MSDLILCVEPGTAKQPKSEQFSGILPLSVLPHFQGFLPDLTIPVSTAKSEF